MIESETAIEKGFSIKLGAMKLYHEREKSKNSFCFGKANIRDRISKIAREANLTLSAKKVLAPLSKNPKEKPQTHWAAINAAHKIRSQKPESLILVRIYNEARTFFQKNL